MDDSGLVSARSLWKRQAAKQGRRGRYLRVPEVTLESVREDAVEAGLATDVARCLNAGKEADIYLALWKSSPIVLKVYRLHRTPHRKKSLLGYSQDVVTYWAAREFWIMQRAYRLGVSVPAPARRVDNMLTMRYLQEEGLPAPMLKDSDLDDPESVLEMVYRDVSKLYENYLVHGDLSKFNILIHQGRPYLIDFPQALDFASRRIRRGQLEEAQSLLRRDLINAASYFIKLGLDVDTESIFERITGRLGENWLEAPYRQPWTRV